MDNYIPRSPRHRSPGATVEVLRAPGALAGAIEAELVNLSRSGFQVRLPQALSRHEQVVMRIATPDGAVDTMVPATVRWQREESPGCWLAGCNSGWQLDLETLGQLFLCEILTADVP
ncbi:MAG: PilZ domain-containing protein [Thermoguttaceae bacterium]